MNLIPQLDSAVIEGLGRSLPGPALDELAAPFSEGAKARHIVDLCAALGLAAVFIDRTGAVFHVGSTARQAMGSAMAIEAGHLIAATQAANDRIQDAVSKSLCAMGAKAVRRSVLVRGTHSTPVHLVALDYPNASPAQLLKVVVVFTRDPNAARADIATLIRHLNRG